MIATMHDSMSNVEREREYSPSSCIGGDYRPFLQAYRDQSAQAREAAVRCGGVWRSARYGDKPAQTLELCMPSALPASHSTPVEGQGSRGCVTSKDSITHAFPPVLLFFHGGYWQELSAEASLFPATDCIRLGMAYAAINHTLAPNASVDQIVDECVNALAWLHTHASTLGIDRRRIVLAGSSAGAHLAAMTALRTMGTARAVRATVLVSGVFDLRPLVGTSINDALGLNAATANALSPLRTSLHGFPETVVCWGAIETAAFKTQSRDFASALQQSGTDCESFEVADRNHFDVILDLCDPRAVLGMRVGAVVQRL